MAPVDPHSVTDSEHPLTKRVHLSLYLDFDSKTIFGSSTLYLERPHNGDLFLDTRALHLLRVSDPDTGNPLPFSLHEPPNPIKGSLLSVQLSGQSSLVVVFTTDPSASALQWLDPPQTSGKTLPYVYTQCQSIHARSIFPCQDTPCARITFSADINIPAEMSAVMSAAHRGRSPPTAAGDSARNGCEDGMWTRTGRVVEHFVMEQSIPPYLFALAAGDIAFRDLGPRSRVYAEPSDVQAAADEFAGVEPMIQQAEKLFGPYEWERFDLLVMPPSFPYGGMENPRMVFLTPAVVVGDRSGLGVVAHELAHSWTGNLITNASNNDFWLNEGFTTYAERRIVETLEGKDRAALLSGLGWVGLKEDVERFKDRPEFTKLKQNQESVDPDEVYSQVPYEKGFHFLVRLEQQIGRPAFDNFLKSYISKFQFSSIDTETFLVFLKEQLPGIEKSVDVDTWVFGTGIPPDALEPKSEILQKVLGFANSFSSGRILNDEDCAGWHALEWQVYLENLPKKLSSEQIKGLDERFHFSENSNWEIRIAFLTIVAFSGYEPCFPVIEAALNIMGRMKYLKPLYSGLLQCSPEGKELAKRVFAEAKPKYHPIAQGVVQGLIKKFDH